MTLTLHIGVIDVPYVERESPAKMKARVSKNGRAPKKLKRHPAPEHKTTGDVATIIEDKYGLFTTFFEVKELEIASYLEEGLGGMLENILIGGPLIADPFAEGCSKIDESFRNFISSREAETSGIEGTPTQAAKRGVNHRLKHPYKKSNPRRPSFDDTGLMMASEKSWIDDA